MFKLINIFGDTNVVYSDNTAKYLGKKVTYDNYTSYKCSSSSLCISVTEPV